MNKAYCKWPAIIGIIIGSLVVISVVWCCARCLCCGAECCCGCLSCFNRCCPSPRKRRSDGYQQQPPPPPQYQQPYYSPEPPTYASAGTGYRGAPVAQTATFELPSKTYDGAAAKFNEDVLPAMPSWQNATSKNVVEEEDVEMEKLDQTHAQQQSLVPKNNDAFYSSQTQLYANPPTSATAPEHFAGGDIGAMHASPYHNYDQARQHATSPVSASVYSQPVHPPTYNAQSPTSNTYDPYGAQQQWGVGGGGGGGYAASVAPSYHTYASAQDPPSQVPTMGRRPVPGSMRDV
ncbi:hypothetical protein EJ03DRAFT_326508 [Teratosphaeria nubilosa]|uniref:Uncharacterized protein n=1 Tax=Teratosphaeria nubilosa TaxID=161662 RepID=A0A6G1LCT0_9PEZI|nr:hypothetical protein EJ03DRAFT_326508 [Teratosphaeria nubilosa]